MHVLSNLGSGGELATHRIVELTAMDKDLVGRATWFAATSSPTPHGVQRVHRCGSSHLVHDGAAFGNQAAIGGRAANCSVVASLTAAGAKSKPSRLLHIRRG
jgi:hypothetical protein